MIPPIINIIKQIKANGYDIKADKRTHGWYIWLDDKEIIIPPNGQPTPDQIEKLAPFIKYGNNKRN
jgi:hypothetical protein